LNTIASTRLGAAGQPTWHANLPLSFHRPRSNDDHVLHACLLLHCGLALPDLGISVDEATWLLRVLLLTSDRALCVKVCRRAQPPGQICLLAPQAKDPYRYRCRCLLQALCHALSALAPTDLASTCPECHPIFAMLLPPQPLPPPHPIEEKDKSHSPASPTLQDNGYHSAVARATAATEPGLQAPWPDGGSEPTSPAARGQQLCLCSKHPDLHYAHDPDAAPVPVQRRLSHSSPGPGAGMMCTDADG
jgi:hypothetical protein